MPLIVLLALLAMLFWPSGPSANADTDTGKPERPDAEPVQPSGARERAACSHHRQAA
jgi:hypothetical protein